MRHNGRRKEESHEFLDLKTAIIAKKPRRQNIPALEIAANWIFRGRRHKHTQTQNPRPDVFDARGEKYLRLRAGNEEGAVALVRRYGFVAFPRACSINPPSSREPVMLDRCAVRWSRWKDTASRARRNGSVNTGFVCAASDAFALDIAAACAVGAKPSDVPTIKSRWNQASAPQTAYREINILGEKLEAIKARRDSSSSLVHTNLRPRFRLFLDKHLRKALRSRRAH